MFLSSNIKVNKYFLLVILNLPSNAQGWWEAASRAVDQPWGGVVVARHAFRHPPGPQHFFFFFINLQPLKKWSTTNYAPCALDREPGCLTDILRPSWSSTGYRLRLAAILITKSLNTQLQTPTPKP